jgi:hypothetical protein
MQKDQRIRDFIHGLIEFEYVNDTDRCAWLVINTPEFQRLRRIRQLGFSEFVFPGATHSRFSHSIGVFHTARRLFDIIERKKSDVFDKEQVKIASLAALLHDVGHGPFSHTFEGAERSRGKLRQHHFRSADIVEGETEISKVLAEVDPKLPSAVAQMLRQENPIDIYTSVIASQFDADRLDYLRRDRYMTGTGLGGFDFDWLLDCLEVGEIVYGVPDEQKDYLPTISFYLNHKGLQAAEEYLLARFHLYSQVYLHKTTRAAEKMLGELLKRVADKIAQGDWDSCALPKSHPLAEYLANATGSAADTKLYLALDDFQVWSALGLLVQGKDAGISEIACRLLERRLFKCFDVGTLAKGRGGNSLQRFMKAVKDRSGGSSLSSAIIDSVPLSCYVYYEYEDQGALQKVHIGDRHGGEKRDFGRVSPAIGAITEDRVTRYYVSDQDGLALLHAIWTEVSG